LIGVIQMPPGSSLQRPTRSSVSQKVTLENPAAHVTFAIAGLDGATFTTAPNAAAMFVVLNPQGDAQQRRTVANELRQNSPRSPQAHHRRSTPPVRASARGRNKMIIEDRNGAGYRALEDVTFRMMMAANQAPGFNRSLHF